MTLAVVVQSPGNQFLAGAACPPNQHRGVRGREMLQQEKGNKVHAARTLGISRRAHYRLIEEYQLEKSESRISNSATNPNAKS